MAERARLEQMARDGIEAFNRSDWDAARALMTPSYVYEEVGTGLRTEGAEEQLRSQQQWKEAAPDATGEILRIVVDGDTVVTEIRWRGTHTGTLHGPAGDLPATGRSFETLAAMFSRAEGDRFAETRHHLDMLGMLSQVGALQAPAHA
jgi:steroid delta-isomerase-like uncharacterized protein